jgi:MFS family permease
MYSLRIRNRRLPRGLFYGWIIVAVTFIIEFIVYGLRYSFSVFYLSILNEFGWSRASTAGIFSLNIIIYGLMAPLSGRLSDRFGPKKIVPLGTLLITLGMVLCSTASEIWHFYILFGVIFAVGSCIAGWSQFAPILAAWFIKRRGIALGIGMAGFGLCFLISPLTGVLIVHLGWRGAFIVLAVLPTLIIAPLTIFFVEHRPEDIGSLPDGVSVINQSQIESEVNRLDTNKESPVEWTLAKAIKTYRFWIIFFANFCALGIGQNMMVAHQVAFIRDIGYSEVFAASIVGVYGIMYAVGNFFGFVSDRLGAKFTFTTGSVGILAAMFLLVTTTDATSLWKLYTYIVLFGFCMGLSILAFNAIIANSFQGRNFGAINGFLMLAFGIGGSLGPWIGGYIFDTTGTYVPAFFIVILAVVIACLFVWIAAPKTKQKTTP